MSDLILLALRGVRGAGRKRLRTTLTVASIAIGVASVVLISSIGQIGREAVNSELSQLGCDGLTVGKADKGAVSPLAEDALETVRGSGGVSRAAGINVDYTKLHMRSLEMSGVVWGVDEAADAFISLEPLYGRMIGGRDIRARSRVCVVDENVANAFYKRENIVGKRLGIAFDSGVQYFTVVGVVRSGGSLLQGLMTNYVPSFVYIPYTSLQQLSGKSEFDQIVVQVDARTDADAAGERIVRALDARGGVRGGYRAENIARQKETLDRLLSTVTLVLSLVAGVSLVVAGLGIMTVMLVSVGERTREIGIKKSIGASRGAILLEFLIEAFVIALVGAAAGAAAGVGLVAAGCLMLGIKVTVSLKSVLTCVLFCVGVGVAFGVYPASAAARMRPVDALRTL